MACTAATTTNSVSDGQVLPQLLGQIKQAIGQVSADGGYDRRTCYEAIAGRGAKAASPPAEAPSGLSGTKSRVRPLKPRNTF